MKISNKRAKSQFLLIYVVLILFFVLNIIDDNVTGTLGNSLSNKYLILLFIITSFLLLWRGLPLFKYDSDGEVLIVKASEPILISHFFGNKFFAEFPKFKLGGYKIKNGIFRKTLYLYLKGAEKGKALKVSISYLNKKEITLLHASLKKVLRKNKKEVINERPIRGRVTA